jgi:N-methylhydantoinase A/oxoprolinase/acetone carboxylase beta subunit
MIELNSKTSDERKFVLGIDVGGTFTDLVLADTGNSRLHRFKILTTPSEPSQAVISGLMRLAGKLQIAIADISYIVHATTLVTNAVIERKGAPTGLITTSGIRDVLEIGRERRYDLYDLYLIKPEPLIARDLRFEVTERIRADGSVYEPLDLNSVDAAARALLARNVRSVAVCLINSYRNPAHELAVKTFLAKSFPDLDVSISSEISHEAGEFERSSTVVVNAYVRPMVRKYLTRLASQLAALQFSGQLEIMLSDGGVCSVPTAISLPVRLIESGPAAGVQAAAYMAEQLGLKRVLSFDMGGTTAKISFVDDGIPASASTFEAARVDRARQGSGLPLQVPTVELLEIGAGGGSIASVDGLGLLKVGPESAGASPGPASYGRGGNELTVTDTNLLLGALDPQRFGFGAFSLDVEAANAALTKLSNALEMNPESAASGVVTLVNEHMTNAVRIYSAERARDLRDYAMVAYGGGGPVHGYELARILGIRRLIFPWGAGTLSAFGLLMSPRSMSVTRTLLARIDAMPAGEAARIFVELEDECFGNVGTTGVTRDVCTSHTSVTMRYAGQGHELKIPIPASIRDAGYPWQAMRAAFESAYDTVFGRALDGLAVEAVNWQVQLMAPAATAGVKIRDAGNMQAASQRGVRKVFFHESDAALTAAIYRWEELACGQTLVGPAIFEAEDCTAVVGPRGKVTVDNLRNLVVDL